MANSTTAATCCICLCEYGPGEAPPFELDCGHRVHSNCMLRMCFSGGRVVRCPYCRAPLMRAGSADDSGDEEEDETVDDVTAEDSDEPMQTPPGAARFRRRQPRLSSPWTEVAWCDDAVGGHRLLQEALVKSLFARAGSVRAPAVLKSCAARHLSLVRELAALRLASRVLKQSQAQGSINEAAAALRSQEAHVRVAERKIRSHKRSSLLRCQRSTTVVSYFQRHPLSVHGRRAS